MKTLTTQEIRDLFNQVMRDEISFSRMVDVLNERISEEDIPEGLEKGDLAIFWDNNKASAIISIYKQFRMGNIFHHEDHSGLNWQNAIKFESKEQYKRLIKGEI